VSPVPSLMRRFIRSAAGIKRANNLRYDLDCGSLVFTDEEIRNIIAANDPSVPGGGWKPEALAWAESLAFQPFTSRAGETAKERIEKSITQDVAYLKAHPLIKPTVKITGWLYDLETGKVEEVS